MSEARRPFSVVIRLTLLLSLGLLSVLIFSYLHFEEHEKRERLMAASYLSEFANQVERVLELHRESLEAFNYDYSWWDEMVDFVSNPNDEDWAVMTEGVPEIFKVDAVWVYNLEGEYIYGVDLTLDEPKDTTSPFTPEQLLSIEQGESYPTFFIQFHGAVMEVTIAPIHTSEDIERNGAISGYLVSGRYWNKDHIESIGGSLASDITAMRVGADTNAKGGMLVDAETGSIQILDIVNDAFGTPVALISVEHEVPGVGLQADAIDWHSGFVFVSTLFLGGVFIYCLIFWVILPMRQISLALKSDNPDAVLQPAPPGREWHQLATLIYQNVKQRQELNKEIAHRRDAEDALVASEAALRHHMTEREELARDLHDGIIQSVYAAGLQVETARLEIDRKPEGAKQLLHDARQSLNVLITDVRRFIAGLAPSRLETMGLKASLEQLLFSFRKAGFRTNVKIDESVLEKVPESMQRHLYYISQELLSNAARHAGAECLCLFLEDLEGRLELTVCDDGTGFLHEKQVSEFSGLKNLKDRAELLGAEFSIKERPEKGTEITMTLTYPLLAHHD